MERLARSRPRRRRILLSPPARIPQTSSSSTVSHRSRSNDSMEVARLEIAEVGEANERYAGASSEKRPAVGGLLVFDHKPPRVQPGARFPGR